MTRTRLFTALLLALAAQACGGLAVPGAQDAQRARSRYPGASVRTLSEARRLFVVHCSGCHTLPSPSAHRSDEWPDLIGEMAAKARLQADQRDLVEQYLVTMSGTAEMR